MAPIPNTEMLDELAVECMDLQVAMAEEPDKSKHQAMVTRMISRIVGTNHPKFQPIPDFEEGKRYFLQSFNPFISAEILGLDWFNVSQPLKWSNHLTGSLVLIDFFTYCCINCLHILPQLHRLEKKFPPSEGLLIIGCHSAKFTNEKSSDNVKAAISRHDITHPVVNDLNNSMWTQLNIQCWPTLLLVSPNGIPM